MRGKVREHQQNQLSIDESPFFPQLRRSRSYFQSRSCSCDAHASFSSVLKRERVPKGDCTVIGHRPHLRYMPNATGTRGGGRVGSLYATPPTPRPPAGPPPRLPPPPKFRKVVGGWVASGPVVVPPPRGHGAGVRVQCAPPALRPGTAPLSFRGCLSSLGMPQRLGAFTDQCTHPQQAFA